MMKPTLKRRLIERLRNSKHAALADGLRAMAHARLAADERLRLEKIALAARRFAFAERPDLLKRWCAPHYRRNPASRWRDLKVGWARYGPGFGDILVDRNLRTSLILKAPSATERGVLYLSFEYNLMRLVASGHLPEIKRRFWLVCSTSWSPTDYSVIGNTITDDQSPILLGISHQADVNNFEAFSPQVVTLPLLASDWLRPDGYTPLRPEERDLDIVMVANWTAVKRHWLLFEALSQMPAALSIALIGRDGDGRTATTIREEAAAYGVRQRLQVLTDIPHAQVRGLLCRARVSPILSYREGSCVAVTEAMFADTPVVLMKDGHIGSSRYIDSATGAFASRRDLPKVLMACLEGYGSRAPRREILKRATAARSSELLNCTLRECAARVSETWRVDIAPLCWDGNPRYLDEADARRLAGAYDEFERDFGIRFVGWRDEQDRT